MSAPVYRTAILHLLFPYVTVSVGDGADAKSGPVAGTGMKRASLTSPSTVGSLVLPPLPHAVHDFDGDVVYDGRMHTLTQTVRGVAYHITPAARSCCW